MASGDFRFPLVCRTRSLSHLVSISYVAPDQINAQVPFAVSGNVTLRVTSLNGRSSFPAMATSHRIVMLLSKAQVAAGEYR